MAKGGNPKSKGGVKAEEKLWRLTMVRDRINEYKKWFYPAPDEVEHLLDQMHDWAKLDGLEMSESKLSELGGNSVFPPLIRFCKKELSRISKWCESRRAAGNSTLPDFEIASIQRLSQATDLETVNRLYSSVERIYVVSTLARAMQTSYRALTHPGTLTDLNISELRGDILEVVAYTHIDMVTVMRDLAEQGIKKGIDQAKAAIAAVRENRILSDQELEKMKTRAGELKAAHLDWAVSEIARQLEKEFPKVAFHTIRKYDWLIKLVTP